MNNFIRGTVEDGIVVGLGAAAVSTVKFGVSYVRAEFDEWNAILDPTSFATIYDAQATALDGAAARTAKALQKQGYEVLLTSKQADAGNGELGKWIENRLMLINAAKGCPKPVNNADAACQVKLRTLYYNAASREAPPKWLSDLNEAFIIRGIGVLTEGQTSMPSPCPVRIAKPLDVKPATDTTSTEPMIRATPASWARTARWPTAISYPKNSSVIVTR